MLPRKPPMGNAMKRQRLRLILNSTRRSPTETYSMSFQPPSICVWYVVILGFWTFEAAQPSQVASKDPIKFLLQWGKAGKGPGEFQSPIGIAINDKDEIFVGEFKNNRVQKFTSHGKPLSQIPVEKMPGGLAVDKEGRIYVTPLMDHKICVYDET